MHFRNHCKQIRTRRSLTGNLDRDIVPCYEACQIGMLNLQGDGSMELRQIQYLLTVAEAGSFTRASLELGVAQPALSRQVKKLEEELGVALLYRHGRGVSATPAGESLLQSARSILAQLDAAVLSISALKEDLAGTAAIGMPPTVGRVLSIPLAHHFRENFPKVGLRIVEAYSGTVLELLRTGRIDAALIYDSVGIRPLQAEPLVQEDLILIGRPSDRPPLKGKAVAFESLGKIKLVLPSPTHALRMRIEEICRREKVALTPELEVDGLHSMLESARDGLGYTIIQASAVQNELGHGILKGWPIVDPQITLTLGLATGVQRSTSFSVRRLATIIRQQVFALQKKSGWRRPK